MRIFGIEVKRAKRSNVQTGAVPWLSSETNDVQTPDQALKVGAVYACVRVIAETVATLPCILYRKLPNGGKERATDHPLYDVLRYQPNPFQTSCDFAETVMGHAVLRGNAYVYVDTSGGRTKFIPLHPDRMRVRLADGGLYKYYQYFNGSELVDYKPSEIIHVLGLSTNGYVGISPVELAMRTMNLAKKQEDYAERLFTNSVMAGGVFTHPETMSEEAQKRIKEQLHNNMSGSGKAGKTLILEEGMTWQQMGLTNEQAQFIEGRELSTSDIAMWFRMPPHKIGFLKRATFSNIESQALEFVTDTIRPWLVKFETAIMNTLFDEKERKQYVVEFLIDALLRGEMQARYNSYKVGRDGGWLSVNEIREYENKNPLPDGKGDIYLEPLNMKEAGAPDPSSQPTTEPVKTDTPAQSPTNNSARSLIPIVKSIVERGSRRRAKITETKEWDDKIKKQQRAIFEEDFMPVLESVNKENLLGACGDMWEQRIGIISDKHLADDLMNEILKG